MQYSGHTYYVSEIWQGGLYFIRQPYPLVLSRTSENNIEQIYSYLPADRQITFNSLNQVSYTRRPLPPLIALNSPTWTIFLGLDC